MKYKFVLTPIILAPFFCLGQFVETKQLVKMEMAATLAHPTREHSVRTDMKGDTAITEFAFIMDQLTLANGEAFFRKKAYAIGRFATEFMELQWHKKPHAVRIEYVNQEKQVIYSFIYVPEINLQYATIDDRMNLLNDIIEVSYSWNFVPDDKGGQGIEVVIPFPVDQPPQGPIFERFVSMLMGVCYDFVLKKDLRNYPILFVGNLDLASKMINAYTFPLAQMLNVDIYEALFKISLEDYKNNKMPNDFKLNY